MEWKEIIKIRLMANFDNSFFNDSEEFIAHKYSNEYFIFKSCESEEDVNCKVLEWLSRSACKGQPYSQEWRNKKFRKFMLDGINGFLNTKFTEEEIAIIYQELGNCVNHKLTLDFVRNFYDMDILYGYE